MTSYDQIDYFTDEQLPVDPYPYFEFLLEHPVWREPHHGVVMVSGYDEALEVYNDPTTFSSCNFVAGPEPAWQLDVEGDDVTELVEEHRHLLPSSDQITAQDPPRHTELRALIMRLITPKRLRENEEFLWRLADRQLDQIIPEGRCEFIDEYAHPYALQAVSELLGVPESDHPDLLGKMGRHREAPSDEQAVGAAGTVSATAYHTLAGVYDYFVAAIEDRRRSPRDDVLTGMALNTFPDGRLPDPIEAARIASNLFAAGQETTVRLLATAMRRLAEQADLQQRLRDNRELIPNFVEEALRTEGPTKGSFRLARTSTNVGGVDIPAGTVVMVLRGAASRDGRRFERPGEFQMDRRNARQHIMFGHGIHTCPGAPLARSEARVTIERFLDRAEQIGIDESHHGPAGDRRYQFLPSYMFRGLVDLHLDYTPAGT